MPFVVHVVESFGAGTLSMVSAMANAQQSRGWRVVVIHSLREETPAQWRNLFREGIEFHHLPMVREIRPGTDLRCGFKLLFLLRGFRPDVVHLHSSKAGALGRLVRPFVGGACWFFSPHGLSFLQQAEGRLKNAVFLGVEKVLTLVPVTFLACSPSEAQLIRDNLSSRVEVIRNAVELPDPSEKRNGQEILRIGIVGRITKARNPAQFAFLARNLMRDRVEFHWLGGGSRQDEETLREAGVFVTGWLDRARVREMLSTLDIYIQTSLWEGLPVAVLEAMAASLPVIATHVVGNIDLVEDGVTGFLVRSDEEFLARLGQLIDNPAVRADFGHAARLRIEREFSLKRLSADLENAYGWGDAPRRNKTDYSRMLGVADALAFITSLLVALSLFGVFRSERVHGELLHWWETEGMTQGCLFLALSALIILRMAWTGHYRTRFPFWDELHIIWREVMLAAGVFGLVMVAARWPLSRFLWPVSWTGAALLIPFFRFLCRTGLDRLGRWRRSTVLIGANDRVDEVVRALESQPNLGVRIDAVLRLTNSEENTRSGESQHVLQREISAQSLWDWLEVNGRPRVIVVQDPATSIQDEEWLERLALYRGGVQVVPSMAGLPLSVEGGSLMFRHDVFLMNVRTRIDGGPMAWLKRGFDVAAALLSLVLLSPFMALVALLIRVQGGTGAILFGHERVGRDGEIFHCWKFRTMVKDSQDVLQDLLSRDPAALMEWEKNFKLKNDPRITSIGAFLRRTSLDELPQLWNVLRGEMSLVGPRPVIAQELERYGNRKAFYCSVRPGITGLWQVSGRNDLSYPERVALDAWYVKNWRFWYDIVILAKTVRAVLRLDGAY